MSDAQVKGVSRTKAAGQAKARDQVRVLYGVHALEASLAGRMVSDVRQALRQPLNISPQAVAVVDGHEVGESFVLLAGQQLEFVRLAGEKGVIPGAPLDPPLAQQLPETDDPRTGLDVRVQADEKGGAVKGKRPGTPRIRGPMMPATPHAVTSGA
jgi:hypothetical protein